MNVSDVIIFHITKQDIPMDYDGLMGVPITFLDKHNPKQFEVLGITNSAGMSVLRLSMVRKFIIAL